MPILSVNHVTTYAYCRPVDLGDHRMMLRPRDSHDQRLISATLDIDPAPQRLTWIHDVFDNCVALASFVGETRRLKVESNITLEHSPLSGPDSCSRSAPASIPSFMAPTRSPISHA